MTQISTINRAFLKELFKTNSSFLIFRQRETERERDRETEAETETETERKRERETDRQTDRQR